MKTPLASSPLAPFTASLVVLGGLLLLPFVSPLAAGGPPGRGPTCQQPGQAAVRCDALVEMEVRDVIPLKEADTHAVVLVSKDQATVLPIFVDEGSAIAIAFRLAHRSAPHPLAHDLMDRLVTELGGILTEVRIDDVHDEIYSGHVLINQGPKKLSIEARPSDSIAMALTKGAKIFATQKVLAEAGITREEIEHLRQKQPGVGGSGPGPGAGGSGRMNAPHPLPSGHDNGQEISL